MTTRRKKAQEARELAEMTPSYAIKDLKGCLYRTHAQKASVRNYDDTTGAIAVYVRKLYPEVADEIVTKRKASLLRPTKPKKPRKRGKKKRQVKKETVPIKTVKFDPAEPGKTSPSKVTFQRPGVEITMVDSDDSSDDDEFEDEMEAYEEDLETYEYKRKRYIKKLESVETGRMYARDVILAQCTREMREKLESKSDFERAKNDSDVISLLSLIKTCGLDFSDEGYYFQNVIHVLRDLLTYTQEREASNYSFRAGLDTRVQKFEEMGGNIGRLFNVKADEYRSLNDEQVKERILAVIMIDQSCNERFGDFKRSRTEDAHLGRTDFPPNRTRAAIALDNHSNAVLKPNPTIGNNKREDETTPSSFAQFPGKDGKECVKGIDGAIWPNVKCHFCKKFGHFKTSCPTNPEAKLRKKKDEKSSDDEKDDKSIGQNHLNVGGVWFDDEADTPEKEYSGENGDLAGFTFLNPIPIGEKDDPNGAAFTNMNERKGKVPGRLLILVDTGATDHIICNSVLLNDIGPASVPKTVVTNAGLMRVNKKDFSLESEKCIIIRTQLLMSCHFPSLKMMRT